MEKISEGIEILTGKEAGEINKKGQYPEDSIYGKVKKTTGRLYRKSIRIKEKVWRLRD